MSELEPRSVGTHNGVFHADEVMACALLLLCDRIDVDRVQRTRDPSVLSCCEYVCDVGGEYSPEDKLFDHHQSGYTGGLSSAGMVLRYLRDAGDLSVSEFEFFDQMIVAGVDAHDNGRIVQEAGVCTFSHLVANYCPIERDGSQEVEDAAFFEALAFTLDHLKRLRARYQQALSCRSLVEESMKAGGLCLFFDQNIPWLENFFELGGESHPARFVVMPSGEHWKLRGIPPSYEDRMSVRQPLPESWAGLLEDRFEEVCGIPGAIFCHRGRFISVWETREAAMQALDEVLKAVEEK